MYKQVIVFSILIFFTIGCYSSEGKEYADSAVTIFHEELNNENYDQIYAHADDEFQQSDSKEKIIEFLRNVRENNGRVMTSKRKSWTVKKNDNGTYVIVSFATEFENAHTDETFVFSLEGKEVKLLNYNIETNE